MIKRIDNIQNFGIFRNYAHNSSLSEFSRYNLVYGWNGSGKSTLSKVFYSVASNILCKDFPDSNFVLSTDNGSIESDNLNTNSVQVHVFNEQFIQENISWGEFVKSLLYISKGKVEEKRKLTIAQDSLLSINRKIDEIEKANQDIDSKNESFLSNTAREIKSQFGVLRTDDRYYINYDKRKLKKIIDRNKKLRHKRPIVNEKDIDTLKVLSKLEFLDELNISLPSKIEIENYEKLCNAINNIITQDLVSKSIANIKNNPSVSTWVEAGIQIHKDLKKCKFCGNSISEERFKKLNEHFNSNYNELKEGIIKLINETNFFSLNSEDLPSEVEIYPFLKEKIYKELNTIRKGIDATNRIINGFMKTLELKLSNPFDTSIKKVKLSKANLTRLNKSLENISKIIEEHNETTKSFNKKSW